MLHKVCGNFLCNLTGAKRLEKITRNGSFWKNGRATNAAVPSAKKKTSAVAEVYLEDFAPSFPYQYRPSAQIGLLGANANQ